MSAVIKPGILLRPMTMDDIDQVFEVETETYEFPWTRGIFHDCLQVGYCCWVFELEGEVVAYGVMSVAAGEAHVLTIVVTKQSRSQGLGAAMMEHLLIIARQRGAATVLLEVRPTNEAAINLYQRIGFSEVGRRKDYYPARGDSREDALVMALDLDTH